MEPEVSSALEIECKKSHRLLKFAVIAGASILAGGLCAVWRYQSTVKMLRKAGEFPHNPHFGIVREDTAEGV